MIVCMVLQTGAGRRGSWYAVRYQETSKQENRVAEDWLLYRAEKEEEIAAAREDILGRSPSSSVVDMSNVTGSCKTDKTGRQGVLLGELQIREQWLSLVSEYEESLPREKQIFLRLRREYRHYKGNRGWTSAIQYKFGEQLDREMGREGIRHRNTLSTWWREIVQELAREALRRGML